MRYEGHGAYEGREPKGYDYGVDGTHTMPHVLVVDDDPVFRAMTVQAGKRRGIDVTACGTMHELGAMTNNDLFDVAIVDYYLDSYKEYLKGTDIAHVMEGTPVILISNSDHCVEAGEAWPQSVRKFMVKKAGIEAILDSALKATATAEP